MFRAKQLKSSFLSFYNYSSLSYMTVKDTLQKKPVGCKILVQGWVQAVRKHKDVYFIDLIDGTCLERLQIVIPHDSKEHPVYASSIKVEGSLIKSSHKGQDVELIAENWNTLGNCSSDYPFLYHQKYSSEYIRQFLHLRPRTRRMSSILRVRNNASVAVHQFFQKKGFCFVHTPIITRNDCEGAGEVFSIELKNKAENLPISDVTQSKKEQTESKQSTLTNEENKDVEEFFGVPTFLTVSGQLHLEAIACAISHVYNFGPVFRAESSQTRHHASEFQMIEAEIAFTKSIDELIETVQQCIKHVASSIANDCYPEVKFLNENSNPQEQILDKIIEKSFVVMSYDEAVSTLEANKDKLKTSIKWGEDFSTDHKKFIVKYCNNIPVFVSMFPAALKPFYMKTDAKCKAECFDLFAPFGGEICGGSLREDDENILKSNKIFENSSLSWYLDLRRYGAVPHGGFGIGFDRLLQSLLGILNIRDIIPFPRRKYDCKC